MKYALCTWLLIILSSTVVSSYTCSDAERITLNTATGLPLCSKVGIIVQPGSTPAPTATPSAGSRRQSSSSYPDVDVSTFFQATLPARTWANVQKSIQLVSNMTFQEDLITVSPSNGTLVTTTSGDTTTVDLAVYDDLLELVHNGTYDFLVGDFLVTRDRSLKVDFTTPYLTDQLGLLYVRPDQSAALPDFFNFMAPINLSTWLVSIAILIFGAICVVAVEATAFWARFSPDTKDPKTPDETRHLAMAWNHVLLVPYGLSSFQPKSNGSRLILWALGFYFAVFVAVYTANAANLYMLGQQDLTHTKSELLAAPMLVPSTLHALDLAAGFTNTKIVVSNSSLNLLREARDDAAAPLSILTTEYDGAMWTRTQCDSGLLSRGTDLGVALQFGFAFRPTGVSAPHLYSLKKKVDWSILDLREKHLLKTWAQSGLPTDTCSGTGGLNSFRAVAIGDLWGLMVVTAAGIMFGLITGLIGSPLVANRERKKREEEAASTPAAPTQTEMTNKEAMDEIRSFCAPSPLDTPGKDSGEAATAGGGSMTEKESSALSNKQLVEEVRLRLRSAKALLYLDGANPKATVPDASSTSPAPM